MATTLLGAAASVDASGQVVSLRLSGECDDCSDLRIEVHDSTSGDVLCSGPVVFSGNEWTKSFIAPDDFTASDLACDRHVMVVLKCRDVSPSTTLLSERVRITCGCSITVDSVQGTEAVPADSGLQHFTVIGTASCDNVRVEVRKNGVLAIEGDASVDDGTWRFDVVEGAGVTTRLKELRCEDILVIKATCEGGGDCTIEVTKVLSCEPECPGTADVRVTGPNGFDQTNPPDSDLECLPAGNYTITCTTAAPAYEWRSNDVLVTGANAAANVVSVNGATMVVTLGAGDNRHFSVSAIISGLCRSPRTVAVHCGGAEPCVVSEFSNWSSCDNGVQTRTRTVLRGVGPCPPLVETRDCTQSIAVDCVVSDWSPWSKCRRGQRTRSRTVVTPASNGGRACPALTQSQACTDIVVDLCLLWLLINIGLLIVTAVLIFLAFCAIGLDTWAAIAALASGGTLSAVFATLTAAVVGLLIAAAIFAVVTFISWVLWIILCLFGGLRDILCEVIHFVLFVLHTLMAIAAVIAVVMLVIAAFSEGATLGCGIGGVVDVAWFGIFEQIFFWIGIFTGCIRPFGLLGGIAALKRDR